MKLYHAILQGGADLAMVERVAPPCVLVSYHYMSKDLAKTRAYVDRLRALGVRSFFMDSGAYSAHTLGATIELADYQRAVEALEPDVYAALDVIGDAEGTRRNLVRMRADGFKPLPIFTRGAPLDDLRQLIDEGEQYVALGNMTRGSGTIKDLRPFLDSMFRLVGPGYKLHAFGVTGTAILMDYPFYSADSTVAYKSAAHGAVRTPRTDGRLGIEYVNLKPEHAWRNPAMSDHAGGKRWLARRCYTAGQLEKFAAHVTKVWAARGIAWDDAGRFIGNALEARR